MDKPLTTPQFRLTLPNLEMVSGFSVTYTSSRAAHCDSCRVFPDEEALDILRGEAADDCLVEMGYEEDFEGLIEGAGIWEKNGQQLLIRDGMAKLFETPVAATFMDCHPQEVLRYILSLCGVEKYVLSGELYTVKHTFSVDEQNACEAIKQMNSAWGIDIPFFFWGDTFYWGERPEQEEVYELNDSNILNLQKDGGRWTADIIGVPWLHHSQYIIIDHEKLIGVGDVEKCVIQSSGSGFCDMYIVFSEVPEDG